MSALLHVHVHMRNNDGDMKTNISKLYYKFIPLYHLRLIVNFLLIEWYWGDIKADFLPWKLGHTGIEAGKDCLVLTSDGFVESFCNDNNTSVCQTDQQRVHGKV